VLKDRPHLAIQFLARHGIVLVIAPHLTNTYLDGAAMRLDDGAPVIGLSVRYDRLDNFWFCLLHELAHVGGTWKTRQRAVPALCDTLPCSTRSRTRALKGQPSFAAVD